MIALRDYQKEAVKAIEAARKHIRSGLIILPVGTGKTVVFAEFLRRAQSRALILAHRDELIRQAADKLRLVWPEVSLGIIQGPVHEADRSVLVASVPTLARDDRLRTIPRVDIVITDEAHHAVAPTYRRIYRAVGAGEKAFHVGFTATANRADRIGLAQVYERVIYHRSIEDMIAQGYLVQVRGVIVRTEVDLSGVASGQDFVEPALEAVVNTKNRNELILKAYLEHARGRKTLLFAAGLAHAKSLAELFKENGIRAAYLLGSMPYELRRRLLKDFEQGDLEVLANYGVLTEGYDNPAINCIVMARPTLSSALYIQMIGRGMRLYPGKDDLLVLDFADRGRAMRLDQIPDLLGKSVVGEAEEAKPMISKKERELASRPADKEAADAEGVTLVAEHVELVTRFSWLPLDIGSGRWILLLPKNAAITLEPAKDGEGYHAHYYRSGEYKRITERPLRLDWAQGAAETLARKLTGGTYFLEKMARWRQEPATAEQISTLQKYGIPVPNDLKKGKASELIGLTFWKRRFRLF